MDDDNSASGTDGPESERIISDHAYRVRSDHLSADLARIQLSVAGGRDAADYQLGLIHAPKTFDCGTSRSARSILVGVTYDGDPAYVAFREPMGDSQVVEVLQCGTGDLLRSTTLPARE